MSKIPKKILIMIRKSPYGTVYPAEALRAAMGLAQFGVEVEILFIHDGVFMALKEQNPEEIEMKALGAVLPELKEMDIKKFYVCGESLQERNITPDQLTVEAEICTPENFEEKLNQFDHIFPF